MSYIRKGLWHQSKRSFTFFLLGVSQNQIDNIHYEVCQNKKCTSLTTVVLPFKNKFEIKRHETKSFVN